MRQTLYNSSVSISRSWFCKVGGQLFCLLFFFFAIYTIFSRVSMPFCWMSDKFVAASSKPLSSFPPVFHSSCSSQVTFEDLLSLELNVLDERVINYVRCHHLIPPSAPPTPYNLTGYTVPSVYNSNIAAIFKNKTTPGFFIECGAADGLYFSSSIALEKDKGWTGILIEANPRSVEILRTRNRKAWVVNACLSPENKVSQIDFMVPNQNTEKWHILMNRLLQPVEPDATDENNEKIETGYHSIGKIPCFPLVTIMAAVGANHIDFMVLDVPGVEQKILKSFPFNTNTNHSSVGADRTPKIDVILSGYHPSTREGHDDIVAFMKTQNYTTLSFGPEFPDEIFFIRKEAPKYLKNQ